MASYIMKYVFKRNLPDLHFGEDPYFVAGDEQRKKFKPVPVELSRNDAQILKKVRRRSYRLDQSFSCCCFSFRIGWSAIIGLIPLIGDVLDALFAMRNINAAKKIDGGLPDAVLAQMYSNLFVDFVIGLVPFVGDIADMLYKCNTRNLQLLEKQLLKNIGTTQPTAPTQAAGSYGATSQGHMAGAYAVQNPQQQQPMQAPAQTQGVHQQV